MLELLAPAGSQEALVAAVQNGANAVYLGFGDFNARRNAKNFSEEEVAAAVSYCHLRGVKVFLTLNTLLTDRELPAAAELAVRASDMGMDAVLVQDLGVLRMLKQVVPDLPVHASTQMSVHTLDGVKLCADLGISRVVLARELGWREIEHICLHSPVEIEVFGHGALCMCYSGQCFFSSVIGGRSGNRGLCAQPCRMKYGWNGKADEYPLSLKDMSLAGHLEQLRKMGVKCVKLEGRMKRPEYVAIVTGVYSRAIREGREPTAEELEMLRQAFSRDGFTDSYFLGKKGPDMFGIRREEQEPKELFAQARATYESGENRKEPVHMFAMVRGGEPAQVGVTDADGRVATVSGPVPEQAINVPLTAEKVEGQLSRTGGTPFACEKVTAYVEPGLSLPLSALNAMRRDVLDELGRQRVALPERRTMEFKAGVRYENPRQAPAITVCVRTADQISAELLRLKPERLYVPTDEAATHPERVEAAQKAGVVVAAALPRIFWDTERDAVVKDLEKLKGLGVEEALVATPGAIRVAQELGFALRGDYGLGVFNSQTLKQLKRMGFVSATASFELRLAQIRDISKAIDTEMIAYGRLPLMITENCIVHNHSGQHTCGNVNQLTDRKGERFPVVKAYGCRNEILNAKKLFLADKRADWEKLGLWAARLQFTTENAVECVQVMERYLGLGRSEPNEITRGLYYRAVE
ncbi:MAG: U32 family peptidase [Oscillospiraceae bacterium]|nr:U32 family peptidase [Oscillospiraceae bacterium]